jgi:hypothetical protein
VFYLAGVLLLLALLATLPPQGVLVPNRSLGGVKLGTTEAKVRAAWGPRVGVCRGCPDRTLYFTYRGFAPQGAAAVFRRGRAVALFTLWSPSGWRTTRSVRLGDAAARLTQIYGSLPRVECGGYYVLTMPRGRTVTAFYVLRERLWAFGLLQTGQPLCR